ncbi:DUF456 domain-containing protein [Nocardioides ferulae]|uniref:DUF456 domain-containing protein n=1 Tax=Nocardioides ferulae TaxID=2340821 RepID=UPI000EB397D5|nr:DUF456 domain-containing protein [Nocardioides ferulae]
MSLTEVVVAIAILIGLVGILVPVLPGSILVLAAIGVWAVQTGGTTAWGVLAAAAVLLAAGTVVKYAVPGRRLKSAGIPASTQWAGAGLAVAGFFVVPVVGIFAGFVLGVYLAERHRLGARLAWPSTKSALAAVGLSILIELAAAVLATLVWVGGVVAT